MYKSELICTSRTIILLPKSMPLKFLYTSNVPVGLCSLNHALLSHCTTPVQPITLYLYTHRPCHTVILHLQTLSHCSSTPVDPGTLYCCTCRPYHIVLLHLWTLIALYCYTCRHSHTVLLHLQTLSHCTATPLDPATLYCYICTTCHIVLLHCRPCHTALLYL